MTEAVIVNIAQQIKFNLVPQALEYVGKLWGVKYELEVLRDRVSTLLAVLELVEEQYYRNPKIQDWLEKLKDAFYDAHDVLEEFNIEALRRELRGHNEISKEVRTFFSSSNQLAFKMKMSYKLRRVMERIEGIMTDRRLLLHEHNMDLADRRLLLHEHSMDLRVEREWRKRETYPFICKGDIMGRDDDKKTVMEFLLGSDMKEDISTLPIVGIAGLGKTALAQYVYNDEKVSENFELKMWVCVSNDFDVKRIVKKIIACAKEEEPNDVAMEFLQSELRKEIEGKRYLLVLDDLWVAENETWLRLKTLLLVGSKRSKILVTTRLPLVAKITGTVPPHFLERLSASASLNLLMHMAVRENECIQDPAMLAIGEEIIKECSGVPLVIRTVGSLLFFKTTKPEWLHFKDHELPQVFQRERIEAIEADRGFLSDERNVDLRVEGEWRKREETHSFIREGDIMGRDDDKKTVMEFLLDSDMKEDVSILPIVGIAGLGKTALAQCVYNDEKVSQYFQLKMWVYVSNDFNMKKIVKNIIFCAKKKEPTEVAMERLQSELRAEIYGKRYLLVLDDLWNEENETWLRLKTLLLEGSRGSKILVTTRLSLVAEITGTVPPHFLGSLAASASLDLLMQMAGRENECIQDPDMLAIGGEIIKECSGVPLVIRIVGSLLFFKTTKPEWLHFKDHELPQVSQRERIEAIEADRGFLSDERNVDLRVEGEWRKREETHSFIREGDIMGRDDDKKTVKEFLLDSDMKEDVAILPIVGIAGLGKTALAQCVYNDEMVSQYFELKMWVHVSNDFNVKKIVKNIIVCAKKKEPTEVVMERLQSELRAEIYGKRYLLVLDDLWNEEYETWLSLKTLLVGAARGSKILITTRLLSVANITSIDPPHILEGLSKDASLDLLMQMAGRKVEEIQNSGMLAISEEIVRKCYGVPLVIRTIGNLLFFKKTKSEWLHFKDHELAQVSQKEESIKSALRLSYDNLPSHLKQCFAFCSLFPQDYEIKKQTLINLWVAEGFIQRSRGSQHLEDIADQYFMDLLGGNFFQDFQKDSFTNKETCKMPALMHDLACLVSGFECWVGWDPTKSIHKKPRHISHGLTSNLMGKHPISGSVASSLRTFLCAPTYREMEQREPTSEADLRQLIQSFKRLRILDLHAAIVKKVPGSICKLKHLTYLDLSHNNALKRLPNSITRLQNLQTLNLVGCSALEELPSGIRKLVSLRNLDIDYCYSLSYMPRGLGRLSSLHSLTCFILPNGKALAKNYCRLGELNQLNNIRGSLCIENLGGVTNAVAESKAANLIGKLYLESLALKWGNFDIDDDPIIRVRDEVLLDGLRPHSNLQKLMINKYKGESFPRWMTNSLESCLPNLVELRFYFCRRCKHLPPLSQLPRLKTLEIWGLTELECIESYHSSTSTASFPSLRRLEIRHCENLKSMPPIPHLEDLILREVNRELLYWIIGYNKLKSLDISQIKFLKGLPAVRLQSLTSLERLGISECEELDLSKDENNNIFDLEGLKSLRFVGILGVPKLACLPRWLLQLNNLEHLSIKECLNLKALPEQMDFQSLQQLEIIRCPSLTSLPEGMDRLKSLSHLKIVGCPNLEERCKKDAGVDWYKIAHVPHIIHKLEDYVHRL